MSENGDSDHTDKEWLEHDCIKPMRPDPKVQVVVCAAIKHKRSGKVLCGARHFDNIMLQHIRGAEDRWADAEQGFIDQWGNFLTRKEAYDIAVRQDQYKPCESYIKGILLSEDLY